MVRIIDSTIFPAASTIAVGIVELEPGRMRELHWHPNEAEWQYYLEGNARMGVFASEHNARTFDYSAGDVGYVPFAYGHYVENTSDDTPVLFRSLQKPSFPRRIAKSVDGFDSSRTCKATFGFKR